MISEYSGLAQKKKKKNRMFWRIGKTRRKEL